MQADFANKRSQRGVMLPLLAVIVGALLFVVAVVGIDTVVTKTAQVRLNAEVDNLCSRVARDTLIHAHAINVFKQGVTYLNQTNEIFRTRIVEARLTLPTMPSQGDFDFAGGSPSAPKVITLSLDPNCGGSRCTFFGDVRPRTYSSTNRNGAFPERLWDNETNAGNTVGCELDAEVDTFFSGGPKLLFGKAVFWRPVRSLPQGQVPGRTVQTAPGLTIAIATEKSDFAGDFNSFPVVLGAAFSIYNPLRLTGNPPEYTPFSVAAGNEGRLRHMVRVSETTANFIGWPAQPSSESERGSLLNACMNPFVLVRNTFVSTIVELASRHGQLRNMTEIVHINPQNRNVTTIEARSPELNPPSRMVAFGEDLTEKSFQLPYITYHSGRGSGAVPPPEFGRSYQDWIEPMFEGPLLHPPSPSPMQQMEALVSAQLRNCYHLYSSGDYGIRRFTDPTINDDLLNNSNGTALFEPLERYGYSPRLRKIPLAFRIDMNETWDTHCPWTFSEACAAPEGRGMNAAELVSSLGTTQHCPYVDPSASAALGRCSAPIAANPDSQSASFDLRPDLLGFFCYLTNNCDVTPSGFRATGGAILSPGVFYVNPAQTESTYPRFDLTNYRPPQNDDSGILLILQGRIGQREENDLRTVVREVQTIDASRGLYHRPITVIYFPTSRADDSHPLSGAARYSEHSPAVQRLQRIFFDPIRGEDAAVNPDKPVLNAIYVFSPYDPEYDKVEYGPPSNHLVFRTLDRTNTSLATEQQLFLRYWLYLLSNPQGHIAQAARNIFLHRILRQERKL